MKPLSPSVLTGFGVLSVIVGFAGLHYGLPTSGSLYVSPNSSSGPTALICLVVGFVAVYRGVVRIEVDAEPRRVRVLLCLLVSLAMAQAALSFAMLLFGALVISGVLGHWVVGPLVVVVPSLVQAIFTGIALRRLASGWPWVRLFRIAGLAAMVPFCFVIWVITLGALAPPSPEPQTWVGPWGTLASSYLVPLSLTLWLMTRRVTDEWGVDVGTQR